MYPHENFAFRLKSGLAPTLLMSWPSAANNGDAAASIGGLSARA